MNRKRLLLAAAVLVCASLACQAVGGGGGGDTPNSQDGQNLANTQQAGGDSSVGGANADTSASGFPITTDAYNVVDIGDGSVVYYTKLSQDEVLEFYRDVYVSRGYTERGLLTQVSDGTFSIVFDGDPSGKAVVIQSVDLGDGSRTVAIRLEDV